MDSILVGAKSLPVRLLHHDQIEEIMALQQKVHASLEDPNRLQQLTRDEILVILDQNLYAGLFDGDQLVASRAFLRPGEDAEHLGKDAGIPEEEWRSVIYSEITVVDSEYQGNGIQQKLGNWWLERLENSDYRYICTTVAPLNIPSMKDKFALGMVIVALKEKYGGKLRYIFARDLEEPYTWNAERELVQMTEYTTQRQLLNDGYQGVSMKQIENVWYVEFAR